MLLYKNMKKYNNKNSIIINNLKIYIKYNY